MHAEASAAKEAFVRLGLADALLDELGQALTEFESKVNAFNAGRREHIGARAELEAVVKDIGEVVWLLDGLNRYRFGADPNLMAVWNAAREYSGLSGRSPREKPRVTERHRPRAISPPPREPGRTSRPPDASSGSAAVRRPRYVEDWLVGANPDIVDLRWQE